MWEFFNDLGLFFDRIFNFAHNWQYDIIFFIMVGIISFVLYYVSRHFYKKAIDGKEKNITIELKILIHAIFIVKVLIICELAKLMIHDHKHFLDSLGSIKHLGYILGGLLALVGLYISYKRTEISIEQLHTNKAELENSTEQVKTNKAQVQNITEQEKINQEQLEISRKQLYNSNMKTATSAMDVHNNSKFR